MWPVRESSDADIHLSTPTGGPVEQVYRAKPEAKEAGQIFEKDDLGRVRGKKEAAVLVDVDDVAEARTSPMSKNILNLSVHDSDDVREVLFPSDKNAYVFEPGRKVTKGESHFWLRDDVRNEMHFDTMMEALKKGKKTFLGQANIRNSQGIYRVVLWRDNLVVQRYLYPEALHEYQIEYTKLAGATKATLNRVLDSMTEKFEPSVYKDIMRERLADVPVAGEAPRKPKVEKTQTYDLLGALEAMVAAS